MKRLKIGIMTFHASHNCGSVLQAYALQNVLSKNYGHEVEIIDFSNPNQRDLYARFSKKFKFKKIARNIFFLPIYKEVSKQYDTYNRFIHHSLNLTPNNYHTSEEMAQDPYLLKYDVIISGGDQIWNVNIEDGDIAYFLDFTKGIKKISYAVSMGGSNINKYVKNKPEYITCLHDFSNISIREGNGQKWLYEFDKLPSEIVADPTLLLSGKEWINHFPTVKTPMIKEPYIFYYGSNMNPEINKFLEKISKKFNKKVYVFEPKNWWRYASRSKKINLSKTYGPEAFLNLIYNASMVFTVSFHGTIFSVLLNKNFWYLDSYIINDDDDRASFLLEQLGLMCRFINTNRVSLDDLQEKPAYEEVLKKIKQLKSKSFEYIEKSLKE